MALRKKFVVYTAIFGDYDYLIDPPQKFDNCDFICFTDSKNLKSDIWKIIFVEKEENLTNPLMNRKYKIFPHLYLKDYDWSLYVDATIEILKNPYDLAKKYLEKYNFVVPKHPYRNSIFEEANECIKLGIVNYDIVTKQLEDYKKEGFPEDFGLSENNVIFRRHNEPQVIKIMENWWEELINRAPRDQLSLPYVLWKNGRKYIFMEDKVRGGEYFRVRLHKHKIRKDLIGRLKNMKEIYFKNNPDNFFVKLARKIKHEYIGN